MFVDPDNWKPSPGIAIEGTALEVVKSHSSLSIMAGPGAGKTELLAQRAAYLLTTGECPPPRRILAIAFKVDAARNLKDRVEQRCPPEVSRRFESLTLHAFAKRTLDQFREALGPDLRPSADYQIIFPNRDSWLEFQRRFAQELPALQDYNANQLSSIVHADVPKFDGDDTSNEDRIRRLWWQKTLSLRPAALTFDMVILLAIAIVRAQPIVRDAIVATYSHVFLDEFQDVTSRQYHLIRAIFENTPAVLTAVGDTKQAIMGWAGALPQIFDRFAEHFGADSRKLQFNFRSNAKIVNLINDLSAAFWDDPVRTECARKNEPSPPDALEGWLFEDRAAEGVALAKFIKDSLSQNEKLGPHDFAILARLDVNGIERRLAPQFAAVGIKLTNEARMIGPVAIQDIMKEPVYLFLVSLLKMAHGVRQGSPFQTCRNILAGLEGLDISVERDAGRSLRMVQDLVVQTVELTARRAPNEVTGEQVGGLLITPERKQQFLRTYREYQNLEYLEALVSACAVYFDECAAEANSWAGVIESLEGKGAVKLMTIHKSKGLEYDTVIFVEFNDDAFWNSADDVNVFFVALSRARERIRFSLTKDARGFSNVNRFLEKLQESGVVFHEVT